MMFVRVVTNTTGKGGSTSRTFFVLAGAIVSCDEFILIPSQPLVRGGPAAVIESRAIPKPIPKPTHSAMTL